MRMEWLGFIEDVLSIQHKQTKQQFKIFLNESFFNRENGNEPPNRIAHSRLSFGQTFCANLILSFNNWF